MHQAAGAMTVRLNVPIEDAMMRLRAPAHSEERPIETAAADVLAGSVDLSGEDR